VVALGAAGTDFDERALTGNPESLALHVIRKFEDDVTAAEVLTHPHLATLVLGDAENFSEQVLSELEASASSYSTHDLVVVGYDQAIVYDPQNANDIAALLEFALVQVHELDWYDHELDERLSLAGAALHGLDFARRFRHPWALGLGRSPYDRPRQELLIQHVEVVRLFEQVTAAVKVTDDLYYASIYRDAMRVFRAQELIEAINRKLELMFRMYSMLADEAESHTSHRLEWIVILLILCEVIISLAIRSL
jgi:hypothetical protein